jgi:DNA-binding NarL/FixJ family response regulator
MPSVRRDPTQILLVDDHPVVRERLAEVFSREPDLLVCGEADSRHRALEAIADTAPDIVLLDLTLKQSDGLELIKDIRARWPSLKILVVSMHDEAVYAERAIRAGARGYINKQEATRRILVAVRQVIAGQTYLSDSVAGQVVGRVAVPPNAAAVAPSDVLSDRELQVFRAIGQGLTTRQIAAELHLSLKTVETYRGRIREKLNLPTSAEVLQKAIAWVHPA